VPSVISKGWGVRMRKCSSGGVIFSRLVASAKKAKVWSIPKGRVTEVFNRCVLAMDYSAIYSNRERITAISLQNKLISSAVNPYGRLASVSLINKNTAVSHGGLDP
jgi:hypothetical protein